MTPELEIPLPARQASRVHKAFILGAGLGTRLRPLTNIVPKPLVPLFHRPLAAWTLDACRRAGIQQFAINTHHLPGGWQEFAADENVTLFHEPVLLETGGGLKNIASWIGRDPLLVHNGDIFSTLPLEQLIAAHRASGLPVTLALRSGGPSPHIAIDPSTTRVLDIREKLGRAPGTHTFSGIYCIQPEFLDLIPSGEIVSVIPAFLELASAGKLGAIVLDEGVWLDLGDRDSYLRAHRELGLAPAIHPEAEIGAGAVIENSAVGAGAVIGSGATIRDSVVWPGATVAPDAELERCIVYSPTAAHGRHQDADL